MLALGRGALLLWLVLSRTQFGRLIRAAANDREMLGVVGVDVSRLFTGVFALGAWLGGLGGGLAAPVGAIYPGMDVEVIAESFIVVVVGGMGSLPGTLLGALIIGQLNSFGILFFPRFALVFFYVLMVVVLVTRPGGSWASPGALERAMMRGYPRVAPSAAPCSCRSRLCFRTSICCSRPRPDHGTLRRGLQSAPGYTGWSRSGMPRSTASRLRLRAPPEEGGPRSPCLSGRAILAAAAALIFGLLCIRLTRIYFSMLTLAFRRSSGGRAQVDSLTVATTAWSRFPCRKRSPASSLLSLHPRLTRAGRRGPLAPVNAPFGRTLLAILENAERAEFLGVHVKRVSSGLRHLRECPASPGASRSSARGLPDMRSDEVGGGPLMTLLAVLRLLGPALGAGILIVLNSVVTSFTEYWPWCSASSVTLIYVFPGGSCASPQPGDAGGGRRRDGLDDRGRR